MTWGLALALSLLLAVPASAAAQARARATGDVVFAETGGAVYAAPVAPPRVTAPGSRAVLLPDGIAAAPADAPPAVQAAVWAANRLQDKPYRYGGGHGSFEDDAYDCSGAVSVALNAAGLLDRPRDSSSLMRFGSGGAGRWITIYANPSHAYVVIAGLRLDTSAAGASGGRGPRWRATTRPAAGFRVRHPVGY